MFNSIKGWYLSSASTKLADDALFYSGFQPNRWAALAFAQCLQACERFARSYSAENHCNMLRQPLAGKVSRARQSRDIAIVLNTFLVSGSDYDLQTQANT